MPHALVNRTHNTTSGPDSAYMTDIVRKAATTKCTLLTSSGVPLIQYRNNVGRCSGTRVIWKRYAEYNCWRDGTYKTWIWKVKFQLLQTLMSSQLSFKLLQLKAILCCSTLQYMRWLVSDPHTLCSLHNACKATWQIETYPLFTKAADETHKHKWMQLDGNREHESVGTNMVICSPRKSTTCEKFVGYRNAQTSWVDDQTV